VESRVPKTALSVVLCLLLAACGGPLDQAGLTSELLETDRAFAARSVEAGAARAFEEFLAEDALQLPDDQPPVAGRSAIVAGLDAMGDDWVLAWEPQTARVGDGGRMGWTWGTWELSSAGGGAEPRFGKYLNVWQRGRDGRWRVSVDMGNGSPAPAEAAATAEGQTEPDAQDSD
jgi:ketosteroid isomerase-like protein